MVYIPSTNKAIEINEENDIRFIEDFFLYYHNFPRTIMGTTPITGYEYESLSSNVYSKYVEWNTTSVSLTLKYTAPVTIRSIILGNPSFNSLTGGLYLNNVLVHNITSDWLVNEEGVLVVTNDGRRIIIQQRPDIQIARPLAPNETEISGIDQKLLVVDMGYEFLVNEVRLSLTGGTSPGHLNYLYAGDRVAIARPESVSYGYVTYGLGKVSDIGVVYGTKRPPRRNLTAKYKLFSDRTRRALEKYATEVQNVTPHVIQAMVKGEEYIAPLFGRFLDGGFVNELESPLWLWRAGSLE